MGDRGDHHLLAGHSAKLQEEVAKAWTSQMLLKYVENCAYDAKKPLQSTVVAQFIAAGADVCSKRNSASVLLLMILNPYSSFLEMTKICRMVIEKDPQSNVSLQHGVSPPNPAVLLALVPSIFELCPDLAEGSGACCLKTTKTGQAAGAVMSGVSLRFLEGDRVLCRVEAPGNQTTWEEGVVVGLWYREKGWPPEFPGAPYEVKLDIGSHVYALVDHDGLIQREARQTVKATLPKSTGRFQKQRRDDGSWELLDTKSGTLPRSFPTLPLWFTEEEKRFLKGTSVDTLLEASHIANDQDLLAMQRWCQQHPETFATCPSLEQLRWAASVVASRAFDSTQAQVLLAPFADALNHSGAPHTRMRDCGDHLLFHTERPVELGEEVMNCYGLQGNTQWLMNGGFLDRSRPCDDLLVTPADVVSAVLDYLMNRKVDSDEEDELGRDPCCKSWHGMAFSPPSMEMPLFQYWEPFLSMAELLPDDLATMILVLCMSEKDYLTYQQQRTAGGQQAVIDLAGEEGEELSEPLLADLYGSLLCLETQRSKRMSLFSATEEDEIDCSSLRFSTEETTVPPEGDDLTELDLDEGRVRVFKSQGLYEEIRAHPIAVAAQPRERFEDFRFSVVSAGFEELVGYSRKELHNKENPQQRAWDLEQLNFAIGSCSRVVFRRKSGDLVEVVVTLRCVKGICIFMCVEVLDGQYDAAEKKLFEEMKDINDDSSRGSHLEAPRRFYQETAEAEESSTLHGVRPENAQNILLLRIGQKRVLQALEEQAEQKHQKPNIATPQGESAKYCFMAAVPVSSGCSGYSSGENGRVRLRARAGLYMPQVPVPFQLYEAATSAHRASLVLAIAASVALKPMRKLEVLDSLKASVEVMVKSGVPRADVELPAGLRLGFENVTDDALIMPKEEPSPEQILQADRELARVFLAMFNKALKNRLSIIFRTSKQAAYAKQLWGKSALGHARIVSMGKGWSAVIGNAFVVLVAPRKPQLEAIARAAEEVDSKTCFILLNARLRGLKKPDPLREEIVHVMELSAGFSPAFHVRLVKNGEGMVFRQLQDGTSPWILARRSLPSTVATEVARSLEEPTLERIEERCFLCKESEDLWHLYNLSMKGDTIKAMTYRKIQKEGSTGTVQTEVKKIQMTLQVKSIEYDAAGNCIRYSGKNCEEQLGMNGCCIVTCASTRHDGFMAAQAAQRLHSGSGAAEVAEALEEEIKSWRRHPGFATAVLKRLGSGANVEELNVIHCNTAIKACCSGAWLQALNFLEQMLQMRLKPDVFTYSSVMTACLKEQKREQKMGPSDVGRRFGSIFHNCKLFLRPDLALSNCGLHALNLAGQWEAAKHLLWQLPQLELRRAGANLGEGSRGCAVAMQRLGTRRADVISFGPAIADVGWKQSALMLETMEASAIEPDRKIFSSFAVTGESEDIWQRSMGLLDLMRQRDLEADVINHSSALAPLAEQLHWQMALAFAAQSDGHHGALSLCNAVLRAVRGEWRMAVAEINGLVMKGLEPDEVSRNTLLAAVGSAERWQTAMQLRHLDCRLQFVSLEVQAAASLATRGSPWEQQLSSLEVLSRSSSDDQAMLSSCLNSCEAASDWQVALALLGSMSVEDFDEVSFGAAISACAKGAHDIARNAASSACERGSQWQFCVFFLDGTSPDLISYNVALSATQKASYWKLPCFLLEEMGEETDEISRDTVIFACAFQWRHALEISAVFKRKFFLPESPVLLGSGALSGAQLNRLAEEVEAALLGHSSQHRSMMFRRLVDCEENQWVKMGAHHTLEIELNNKLTLGKDRWDAMHLQELDEATDVHKTSEASVEEIERLGVAELGKAAKISLAEGDLDEERWKRYGLRASELVGELSFQEASTRTAARFASAFSTARYVEFPLFAKLSARALDCLPRVSHAKSAFGFGLSSSTVDCRSDQTGEDTPKAVNSVSASDLRRMAMACGKAQCFDGELLEAMVPLIEERLQDFRPRELVHVADAYARLPVQSPELFALVAEALPRYLYELRPPELASLCRAFAEVALYNEELTDALGAEVEKRARSFGAMECLIFLDGLSPVIAAVAEQLSGSASSLKAVELVRGFAALVRLDYYNARLVHGRICAALALKFNELVQDRARVLMATTPFARPPQAFRGFAVLAELLNCLSLLPAQSHKSMELTTATTHAMTELLEQLFATHEEDLEPPGAAARDATASVGRLPEPQAVSMAAVALAQLGRVEEEAELLQLLAQCVAGPKNPAFLALASEEELKDLQGEWRWIGWWICPSWRRPISPKATTTNYDKALVRFFEQVYQGIKDHVNLDLVKCDDFLAWMIQRATQSGDTQLLQKKSNFVSVHASCVHKQALKELLADEQVQKSIANTKAAAHLKALEEFYLMVQKEPDRVCYGPKQVFEAVEKCAVQTLMVVDSLFRNANVKLRRQYVDMVENARDQAMLVAESPVQRGKHCP
eukprot:g1187.t1